jgi:hypothetical protein
LAEQRDIVAESPEPVVAVGAEQSADAMSPVVVIDVESARPAGWPVGPADRATRVLLLQECVEFVPRQPVDALDAPAPPVLSPSLLGVLSVLFDKALLTIFASGLEPATTDQVEAAPLSAAEAEGTGFQETRV